MSQHICQPGDVLAGMVEGPGEEVAQIVRVDLFRGYAGGFTELFHFSPYLPARQVLSASGAKNGARSYFLLFCVFQKLAA